jgi:hypothetical protein
MVLQIPRIGMYFVTKLCKFLLSKTDGIFDTFSEGPSLLGQRRQVKISDLKLPDLPDENQLLELKLGLDILRVKFSQIIVCTLPDTISSFSVWMINGA